MNGVTASFDSTIDSCRVCIRKLCSYNFPSNGGVFSHGTYRIWLKKPNYARLEVTPAGAKGPSGILVGDGDYFWTYWPAGKPRYGFEFNGKYAEEYKKYGSTFYMKKPTPVGKHSIGHEIGNLASLAPTIMDPSTFHGYTDSLQPYVNGVRAWAPTPLEARSAMASR